MIPAVRGKDLNEALTKLKSLKLYIHHPLELTPELFEFWGNLEHLKFIIFINNQEELSHFKRWVTGMENPKNSPRSQILVSQLMKGEASSKSSIKNCLRHLTSKIVIITKNNNTCKFLL